MPKEKSTQAVLAQSTTVMLQGWVPFMQLLQWVRREQCFYTWRLIIEYC